MLFDCETSIAVTQRSQSAHICNLRSADWFDFAKKILKLYGSNKKVEPVDSEYFKDEVKRPKYSITSKQKIIDTFNLGINKWDSSLTNYIINDLK